MPSNFRLAHRAPTSSRRPVLALALCAALATPAAAVAAAPAKTTTPTAPASTTPASTTPATTTPAGTAPAGPAPASTAPAGTAPARTAVAKAAPARSAAASRTATTPARTTQASTTPTTTTPATTTPTTTTPATTTPTATTPTTTTPTTKPKPKPAKATPNLYLSGLFSLDGRPVTIPGRAVEVTGVVRPFVPGQWVILKAYLDGRLFKLVHLQLKPSPRRAYGRFVWPLSSPGYGNVSVVVEHAGTTTLAAFTTSQGYAALDTNVGFGSTGRFVELVQQRLSAMHFYIPLTGVYDQGTGLAIDAYHRLLGWGTSQLLGPATVNALLDNVGSFQIRDPGQGRHAEGDLSDQLLALANGSQVYWILPISSGKPSTPTIIGSYQIYSRVPGYLPDGMYYSDFFVRGYAIHGYDPAPDYPASHGCMRLPIVDAIPVFNWLSYGDWVDTYYT